MNNPLIRQQQQGPTMGGLFSKATELKSRLLFVLGALIIYRIGTYIPLPGINTTALNLGSQGGLMAMFNMFSGGALGRMTIFALNVFPYITASIIMQLMALVSKNIEAMKKEGDNGRRIINQYTKYLTILIAGLQGIGFAFLLERAPGVVAEPGFFFRISIAASIVGGVMFLVWLGEQITSRGIGNGTSIIIAAGIIAQMPQSVLQMFESARQGAMATSLLLGIIVASIAMILLIIFVERAQRKILIQYPKRQVSANRMTQGDVSHMPLKINTAGVIPAIFASALLGFPITLAGFSGQSDNEILQWINLYLSHGKPLFIALFGFLIVFFCFFYTAVLYNPTEISNNLKKHGGFIPGVRPGEKTAQYLDFVLTRLTVVGAIYLTIVCVVPEIFISKFQINAYIGGTSFLIVVTVILDFVQQVQTHLISHQYQGILRKMEKKKR